MADGGVLAVGVAHLTSPGEEFELRSEIVGGISMRVYRRGPATLRDLFVDSATFGDRTCWVFGDETYSYTDQLRTAAGLARRFREEWGLVPGDRVAIAMRNYPEWGPVFWAALASGLIVVPMNAWWTAPQLTWALGDSGASLLVADGERTQLLEGQPGLPPIICVRGENSSAGAVFAWSDVSSGLDRSVSLPDVPIDPHDDATILYTSGTTGLPKGVVATHRNHCTNALNVLLQARAAAWLATQGVPPAAPATTAPTGAAPAAQPGTLLAYPLFHMAGLNALYGAVLTGAKLATMFRWDPREALTLIAREQLTAASGVPTVMGALAELAIASPREVSSLRRIGMGGAAIPPSLVGRIADGFDGRVSAANGYGLTETTSAVCANSGEDYFAHPDSVGRTAPGAELKFVDPATAAEVDDGTVGELWFRGPNVARGYWNNPQATAAAFGGGWFRTGDLGYRRDGWVHIVDRLKDVVVRGGENIYSGEVEAALQAHPAVAEVAVVGVAHPTLGEEVAAIVCAKPDAAADTEALLAFVRDRLPRYAIPTRVVWRPGPLPRNAAGKILKASLRDELRSER